MWDLAANQMIYDVVPDGKTPIRSIAVAADASLLLASNNKGTVFAWKFDSAKVLEPLQRIEAHNTFCLKTVLSPDGKYVTKSFLDQ